MASVQALARLTSVGNLSLVGLPLLKDLTGLEALSKVTGTLQLYDNAQLVSIASLSRLNTVGSVDFQGNTRLKRLDGLVNLAVVSGSMIIGPSAALESLADLARLTSVGTLQIWGNDKLKDLRGLENLTHVGGVGNFPYLEIGRNASLTSLQGLSGLVSLDGSLTIEENPVLANLMGIERLANVAGSFNILLNPMLASLSGLEGLRSTEHFQITGCERLTSLRALAGLTSVKGPMAVVDNRRLPTCEAQWLATHVTTVAEDITISGNDDAGVCR